MGCSSNFVLVNQPVVTYQSVANQGHDTKTRRLSFSTPGHERLGAVEKVAEPIRHGYPHHHGIALPATAILTTTGHGRLAHAGQLNHRRNACDHYFEYTYSSATNRLFQQPRLAHVRAESPLGSHVVAGVSILNTIRALGITPLLQRLLGANAPTLPRRNLI